jgi:hypothetical protein
MPSSTTKVAIMQPHLLPWLGWFELLAEADLFVLLDDAQFTRHSWSHRNRIFTAKGQVGFVSLTTRRTGSLDATFLDVAEGDDRAWRKKLRTTVAQVYARMPGTPEALDLLDEWFAGDHPNVASLERAFAEITAARLGITTPIVASSSLGLDPSLRRSWWVAEILRATGATTYLSASGSYGYMAEDALFPLAGLDVRFQAFEPTPYPQPRPGGAPFEARLSILDAIACNGIDATRPLVSGTARWLTLTERGALDAA